MVYLGLRHCTQGSTILSEQQSSPATSMEDAPCLPTWNTSQRSSTTPHIPRHINILEMKDPIAEKMLLKMKTPYHTWVMDLNEGNFLG